MPDNNRTVDLELSRISRRAGKGLGLCLARALSVTPRVMSTGSRLVDSATGLGGWPLGRIVELYGKEGVGKSTLGLHLLKEAQQNGRRALLIDSDHSFSSTLAVALGIDLDALLVCRAGSIEEIFFSISEAISTLDVGAVVVDSVTALYTSRDFSGGLLENAGTADKARYLSRAIRLLLPKLMRHQTVLMLISQMRTSARAVFGPPVVSTTGSAVRHYASVRAEIRRLIAIREESAVVGARTKVTVVKNKLAAPFREAEFDLIYGKGICPDRDLLHCALAENILQAQGNKILYGGSVIARSESEVLKRLRNDRGLHLTLAAQVSVGRLQPLLETVENPSSEVH